MRSTTTRPGQLAWSGRIYLWMSTPVAQFTKQTKALIRQLKTKTVRTAAPKHAREGHTLRAPKSPHRGDLPLPATTGASRAAVMTWINISCSSGADVHSEMTDDMMAWRPHRVDILKWDPADAGLVGLRLQCRRCQRGTCLTQHLDQYHWAESARWCRRCNRESSKRQIRSGGNWQSIKQVFSLSPVMGKEQIHDPSQFADFCPQKDKHDPGLAIWVKTH